MFFTFTFIAGLIAFFLPLLLLRILVQKWHVQPKIFWKAGIAGILVAMVVFGVTLNIDGTFPGFNNLAVPVQAFILGLVNGLFMELGRFFVLDRLMPAVRHRESGIIFGLGWSGVSLLVTGVFLIIGVFGMQNILNTKDFASVMPNADADQIQFFQESQKEIQALVNGSPFKAFTPLIEAGAMILVDIAMALLIILGLNRKQTRYAWFAAGFRTVLTTVLFFVEQTNLIPVEYVFGGWMIAGGAFIYILQKSVTSHT